MKKQTVCKLLFASLLAVGIALDQLTKFLAAEHLRPIASLPLWKGVLHLTYVENRGAAFGMLAESRWVFMAVSAVALSALLVYFYFLSRRYTYLGTVALGMIGAGGIGNMIDRTVLGYVVDFIDFTLINFAVFNLADTLVCVGAGLLVLAILIEPKRKESKDDPSL